jgi:DNA-binding beta-propeller fold protein YncE
VVFAGGQAFVSCSRSNAIRVFDTATRAEVTPAIAVTGLYPRALTVSNDGTKVYAAIKFSGNKTTLLPPNLAPPQPPPTNTALPAPPRVSLIVPATDSRLQPPPNMPDNDVAEITVSTRTVARYFKGVGTINFAIAARPGTDELWVANTEARNLVRFEPVLNGHLVDNRVTRIATTPAAGTITHFDLNPTINYSLFPDAAGQAVALAQPTGIVFEADGLHFWIAAFGSDRVARVNAATGAVETRVETGPTTGGAADPRNKRGTRGLALQSANDRLYAINRISNTITVIRTTTGAGRNPAQAATSTATGTTSRGISAIPAVRFRRSRSRIRWAVRRRHSRCTR